MAVVREIASARQLCVLRYLAEAARGYPRLSEAPFVGMPAKIHARPIRQLMMKDYMVCSPLDGVPQYKITSRGQAALKTIDAQNEKRAHRDGLCLNGCGRPVYVSPAGNKKSRCMVCLNAQSRARYARTGQKYSTHLPCSNCGAKRHITPSGRVLAYCQACQRDLNRKTSHSYEQRLAQRVANGEEVKCSRCHDKPVKVTVNGRVTPYCQLCLADMRTRTTRRSRMKKRQRKIQAFLKRD